MNTEKELLNVEEYKFEPIKGYPMLNWKGKRPYTSTQYYPAQLKEVHGNSNDEWLNKIFWGDNLQVMSHLLKEYRGRIKLVYIDPPFDSKADYKKKIKIKGKKVANDSGFFEETQYTDIWNNDEYLQFMYERLIIIKELLAEDGVIYLHCDSHKSHHLRCIMDEIFGPDNFQNEIIWWYLWGGRGTKKWNSKHDNILFYSKSNHFTFNYMDVLDNHTLISESAQQRVNYKGALVNHRENSDSEIPSDKVLPSDTWYIATINAMAKEKTNYPTQKPKELLRKIILASSNPGDIVLDCFMGSGTTQDEALKLGRKFIGSDINLGAVRVTTNRLLGTLGELKSSEYTGFEVYTVNNYDIFRNAIEAKEILIEALEIQKISNSIFDGEKDGFMVKILPVDRISTKADLNDIIVNLDYKAYEQRQKDKPNQPVENILLVCMGHEADLAASLEKEIPYKVKVEVVDVLRDRANLEFKRDSEALITIENNQLVIQNFYPMNLLQKLSIMKENVTEWKELVESVMIDWNFDGAVLEPSVVDIPNKNEVVDGVYEIPENAGTIRVKITDLLSESYEVSIENE